MFTLRRRLFLSLGIAPFAFASPAQSAPDQPTISCLQAQGSHAAACFSASAADVMLNPNDDRFALLLNFGVAWPNLVPNSFDLVCEEAYGGQTPERALMLNDGTLFIPTLTGLRRGLVGDGCSFTSADGIPPDSVVHQVVSIGKDSRSLLALATNTNRQRVLYRSDDGGANFVSIYVFATGVVLWQVLVAPLDPQVVYVAGTGANGPFALGRSDDGGITFQILDPLPALQDAFTGAALIAVSPEASNTIYFARSSVTGPEEIWRSLDGGASLNRLLVLEEGEIVSGFTFGQTSQNIFVAGRRLLETKGVPPAHLFVSTDGGDTWMPGQPSSVQGPRFQCLRYRRGELWACGGDPARGDTFLLGRSADEGKTWQAVTSVPSFLGVKSCAAPLCPATSKWLCDSYGLCNSPDGGVPGTSTDAGTETPAGQSTQGCGCQVGSAKKNESAAMALVFSLLALALGRITVSDLRLKRRAAAQRHKPA